MTMFAGLGKKVPALSKPFQYNTFYIYQELVLYRQ